MQVTKSAQVAKPKVLRLPIYASERRALLVIVDMLLINLALLYFYWLDIKFRFPIWVTVSLHDGPRDAPLTAHPEWFVVLTVLWLIFASINDLYDPIASYDTVRSILSVTAAVAMSIGVYTFIPYLSPPIPGSRFDLLALFIICTCFVAAWRVAYVRGLAGHLFGRRILIIGAGYAGRTLAAAMKEVDQRNYSAIGFIDDDVTMLGKNVEGLTVLGTSSDMATVVEEYSVDEVILAISNGLGSEVLKAIVQCHYHGVPVTPMPSFFETIRGMVPVQHMGQNWIVSLQTQNRSHIFPMVKRGVDIVVSLIGLPFLILVFPFAAVAIKLTSPGPVFYKQSRLGRRARPFEIIKFRTMYDNAEAEGKPIWAAQNDVRVTPVGRFLRRTHLDELPQVINVLRGEMSLIGPRPERPELADSLESEIPFYRNRLLVRPGLTGWAQVKYGYGSTLEDALIKLQYDLYYIKYGSLYLDSVIAYKTLATILRLSGR